MSTITLDEQIQVDSRPSTAVDGGLGQPPLRNRPHVTCEDLWAFDEAPEQERYERIEKRLIRLESALFEEYGKRIDRASGEGLKRLFVACPSVRVPIISAQPNGVLTATWRKEDGVELAVRVISRNLLHFALAKRSSAQSQVLDRTWGTHHSLSMYFVDNADARAIAE